MVKKIEGTLKKNVDIEINHSFLNIKKAGKACIPFGVRFQMRSEDAGEKYPKGEFGDDIEVLA